MAEKTAVCKKIPGSSGCLSHQEKKGDSCPTGCTGLQQRPVPLKATFPMRAGKHYGSQATATKS